MPGINVIDGDGEVQRFPDATTWHVDDRGQLHLKSNDAPVASFAKDAWQGAGTDDEMGPGVKRATLDDIVTELRAIREAVEMSQAKSKSAILEYERLHAARERAAGQAASYAADQAAQR